MQVDLAQEPHKTRAQDYLDGGYTAKDYLLDQCMDCAWCGAFFDDKEDDGREVRGVWMCCECAAELTTRRVGQGGW